MAAVFLDSAPDRSTARSSGRWDNGRVYLGQSAADFGPVLCAVPRGLLVPCQLSAILGGSALQVGKQRHHDCGANEGRCFKRNMDLARKVSARSS